MWFLCFIHRSVCRALSKVSNGTFIFALHSIIDAWKELKYASDSHKTVGHNHNIVIIRFQHYYFQVDTGLRIWWRCGIIASSLFSGVHQCHKNNACLSIWWRYGISASSLFSVVVLFNTLIILRWIIDKY